MENKEKEKKYCLSCGSEVKGPGLYCSQKCLEAMENKFERQYERWDREGLC